jgi:hypothetical protein
MKVNQDLQSLCQQIMVGESTNRNRASVREHIQAIERSAVFMETEDFDKAIALAKRFNKPKVIELLIKHKEMLEDGQELQIFGGNYAFDFLSYLDQSLGKSKSRETKDEIHRAISNEFPTRNTIYGIERMIDSASDARLNLFDLNEASEEFFADQQDQEAIQFICVSKGA